MNITKGFILSALLFISTFANANEECIYTSRDYKYTEELTKECKENLRNYSVLNKFVETETNKDTSNYKKYLETGINSLKGNVEVREDDISGTLMEQGFSRIVVVMTILGILFIIFKAFKEIFLGAAGKETNFKSLAALVITKISTSLVSKTIIIFCLFLSFGLGGVISYHFINKNVKNEVSDVNLKRIISTTAKSDAEIKANQILNYAVCSIVNDKMVFATEHFDNEYRFREGSDYQKCMRESDETTIAEDSQKNYNSKFFKKFLNCSRSHAGVETASCMSSNFSAEQQEFKKLYADNEEFIYSLADKFIRYSCANIVALRKENTHDYIHYCYDLNYQTREVIYSDSGRVQVIKTSPEYQDIKSGVNTLIEKIKNKNVQVAIESIKEKIKPKEYVINELNLYMSYIFSDTGSKEVKGIAEKTFDYNLTNNTILRFNKDNGELDIVENYFDGDIKLPEINDRVLNEISKLTTSKENLKEYVYPVVDFFGNGILTKFGFEDDKEKKISPNIIGNIFSAGMHVAQLSIELYVPSKTTAAVAGLDTTLRTSAKPNIILYKLKAVADFISSKLFWMLLVAVGLMFFVIYTVFKAFYEGFFSIYDNFIRMFSIKDTALLLAEQKNAYIVTNSLVIPALTVLFSVPIVLISFILSNIALYIVVWIMSDILEYVFQAIGFFDVSDMGNLINTMMLWIVFYFFIIYAFKTAVSTITTSIFDTLNSHIVGSQNREMIKLMGNNVSETSAMNVLRKGRF